MNFLLADIERTCPEEDVLDAELLLEKNAVSPLRELERNLWSASVMDGKLLEVEISATLRRVSAASCECSRFLQSKSCPHVVAVLLHLRRFFQDRPSPAPKTPKKITPKSERPNDGKLTISGILDQVPHDDLMSFVKHYARYNRNFAIALKTRFAIEVDSGNSREKYAQLLEVAVADARRPDRSFSRRGSQKIAKVLGELQLQIEDLLAKSWFAEVFPVLQNIIEKITPILRKAEDSSEIISHLDQTFALLQQLLDSPIPPALRDQIWDYAYHESQKLVYRNTGMDKKFLALMLTMANDETRFDALMAYLDKQIDRYFWEKRELPNLIITKLELLEKAGREAELAGLLQQSINHPDVLRFAISRALQEKKYNHAAKLAEHGLQMEAPQELYLEMDMVRWFIAEEQKDKPAILKFGQSLFVQTQEWRFALSVQKAAGAGWPEIREQLISDLQVVPLSSSKNEAIAMLLAADGLLERLMDFVEKCRSVDLLMHHDKQLIPAYPHKILMLYKEWLHKYLHDHVGRKPSKTIRHLVEHLLNIDAITLANALIEEFRQSYPERHTLMEELQSLQSV